MAKTLNCPKCSTKIVLDSLTPGQPVVCSGCQSSFKLASKKKAQQPPAAQTPPPAAAPTPAADPLGNAGGDPLGPGGGSDPLGLGDVGDPHAGQEAGQVADLSGFEEGANSAASMPSQAGGNYHTAVFEDGDDDEPQFVVLTGNEIIFGQVEAEAAELAQIRIELMQAMIRPSIAESMTRVPLGSIERLTWIDFHDDFSIHIIGQGKKRVTVGDDAQRDQCIQELRPRLGQPADTEEGVAGFLTVSIAPGILTLVVLGFFGFAFLYASADRARARGIVAILALVTSALGKTGVLILGSVCLAGCVGFWVYCLIHRPPQTSLIYRRA